MSSTATEPPPDDPPTPTLPSTTENLNSSPQNDANGKKGFVYVADPHYSVFDPPPSELGKRCRKVHNYSALAKGALLKNGTSSTATTTPESGAVAPKLTPRTLPRPSAPVFQLKRRFLKSPTKPKEKVEITFSVDDIVEDEKPPVLEEEGKVQQTTDLAAEPTPELTPELTPEPILAPPPVKKSHKKKLPPLTKIEGIFDKPSPLVQEKEEVVPAKRLRKPSLRFSADEGYVDIFSRQRRRRGRRSASPPKRTNSAEARKSLPTSTSKYNSNSFSKSSVSSPSSAPRPVSPEVGLPPPPKLFRIPKSPAKKATTPKALKPPAPNLPELIKLPDENQSLTIVNCDDSQAEAPKDPVPDELTITPVPSSPSARKRTRISANSPHYLTLEDPVSRTKFQVPVPNARTLGPGQRFIRSATASAAAAHLSEYHAMQQQQQAQNINNGFGESGAKNGNLVQSVNVKQTSRGRIVRPPALKSAEGLKEPVIILDRISLPKGQGTVLCDTSSKPSFENDPQIPSTSAELQAEISEGSDDQPSPSKKYKFRRNRNGRRNRLWKKGVGWVKTSPAVRTNDSHAAQIVKRSQIQLQRPTAANEEEATTPTTTTTATKPTSNKKPKVPLLKGITKKRLKRVVESLKRRKSRRKKLATVAVKFKDVRVDIINCVCGRTDEFGLMVQCEVCFCWQHGGCFGIIKDSYLPRFYVCQSCASPKNVRSSKRTEGIRQETYKKGILPVFPFTSWPSLKQQRIFKRASDLSHTVASIQSSIHQNALKASIATAEPEHKKLYQWSAPRPHPKELLAKYSFNKYYKPVLRRLVLKHKGHPDYMDAFGATVIFREKLKKYSAAFEEAKLAISRKIGSRGLILVEKLANQEIKLEKLGEIRQSMDSQLALLSEDMRNVLLNEVVPIEDQEPFVLAVSSSKLAPRTKLGEFLDTYFPLLREKEKKISEEKDVEQDLPEAGEKVVEIVKDLPEAGEKVVEIVKDLPEAGEKVVEIVSNKNAEIEEEMRRRYVLKRVLFHRIRGLAKRKAAERKARELGIKITAESMGQHKRLARSEEYLKQLKGEVEDALLPYATYFISRFTKRDQLSSAKRSWMATMVQNFNNVKAEIKSMYGVENEEARLAAEDKFYNALDALRKSFDIVLTKKDIKMRRSVHCPSTEEQQLQIPANNNLVNGHESATAISRPTDTPTHTETENCQESETEKSTEISPIGVENSTNQNQIETTQTADDDKIEKETTIPTVETTSTSPFEAVQENNIVENAETQMEVASVAATEENTNKAPETTDMDTTATEVDDTLLRAVEDQIEPDETSENEDTTPTTAEQELEILTRLATYPIQVEDVNALLGIAQKMEMESKPLDLDDLRQVEENLSSNETLALSAGEFDLISTIGNLGMGNMDSNFKQTEGLNNADADLLLNVFDDPMFSEPPPSTQAENSSNRNKSQGQAPVPQQPIVPSLAKLTPEICKGFLLDDIRAHQQIIDAQLDKLEADIMELERRRGSGLKEKDDRKTFHMLYANMQLLLENSDVLNRLMEGSIGRDNILPEDLQAKIEQVPKPPPTHATSSASTPKTTTTAKTGAEDSSEYEDDGMLFAKT